MTGITATDVCRSNDLKRAALFMVKSAYGQVDRLLNAKGVPQAKEEF